ncbi:MAG: SAVED domain-containing protein [Anaerolineaceae bacterium]|nr:SAVED domain-containing protein [Anaerolineaceae bacterium]
MNVLELAKNASEFFSTIKPGVTDAIEVGSALGTVGKTVIQLIQKGKDLYTFRISPAPTEEPAPEPIPAKRIRPSKRPNVAILVDINQRTLRNVASYLDKEKIQAEFVIVTNDPSYGIQPKRLDVNNPDEWTEIIREFCTVMNGIKFNVGDANVHIFLAAPLPIAFGMGTVWGTVNNATIYHWENETYNPVVKISRDLRK